MNKECFKKILVSIGTCITDILIIHTQENTDNKILIFKQGIEAPLLTSFFIPSSKTQIYYCLKHAFVRILY